MLQKKLFKIIKKKKKTQDFTACSQHQMTAKPKNSKTAYNVKGFLRAKTTALIAYCFAQVYNAERT